MPSLINRVPPGLLSLLGVKALGQNPSILPDTVQPQLELLDMYLAGNAQEAQSTTSAINLPGIWGVTTPAPGPGEMFYVQHLSVGSLVVLAAATGFRVQCAMYDVTAANKVWTLGPEVAATTGEMFFSSNYRPFILPAGYRLAAFVSHFLAGGVATQLRVAVRYVPLSI